MTSLASLWLPILISAVLVFIASSVIHMALPWHRDDYRSLPQEEQAMEALRPFAIPPGDYMVPRAGDMAKMKTPEFQDKLKKGPVMVLTVMPSGTFSMGRPLLLWFIYSLVVGWFAAYVAGSTLAPATPYLKVFQVTGTVAFASYALALWPMSIWYRRSLGTTVRSTIDGLIYGALSAGVFGWLWPPA
ncbi:MAG: hypothetical protein JO133_04430 [Burkholderiaceae bacterium]|nr:hypothetical protein [Burkholderiaceae bacterium]